MSEAAQALLKRPMSRYVLVGGSVYLLEVLTIVVAQRLGATAVVSVGISFWLGLVVSFGLQKIVTFGDQRIHHTVLIPQLAAFTALVLVNFGFTLLVTKLLSPPLPAILVRTAALGATTTWNFYLYKTHIFLKAVVT